MSYFAVAIGTATRNKDGKIIEAWYPQPILAPSDDLITTSARSPSSTVAMRHWSSKAP